MEGQNGLKRVIFQYDICVCFLIKIKKKRMQVDEKRDKVQYYKFYIFVRLCYFFMCVYSNYYQGMYKCGILVNYINGVWLI